MKEKSSRKFGEVGACLETGATPTAQRELSKREKASQAGTRRILLEARTPALDRGAAKTWAAFSQPLHQMSLAPFANQTNDGEETSTLASEPVFDL